MDTWKQRRSDLVKQQKVPALNFEKIRLRLRESEKRNKEENCGEWVGDDEIEIYSNDHNDIEDDRNKTSPADTSEDEKSDESDY